MKNVQLLGRRKPHIILRSGMLRIGGNVLRDKKLFIIAILLMLTACTASMRTTIGRLAEKEAECLNVGAGITTEGAAELTIGGKLDCQHEPHHEEHNQ